MTYNTPYDNLRHYVPSRLPKTAQDWSTRQTLVRPGNRGVHQSGAITGGLRAHYQHEE
jgi:hypothetical protein